MQPYTATIVIMQMSSGCFSGRCAETGAAIVQRALLRFVAVGRNRLFAAHLHCSRGRAGPNVHNLFVCLRLAVQLSDSRGRT